MARPAVLDQSSVLNIRVPRSKERIYLKDLSKYLGCGTGLLRRYAKRHHFWHAGDVVREPEWVTVRGAMQLIAWARARQEVEGYQGRSYHERREYQRAWRKRLANSRAGTDAEPQRGRAQSIRAVGEAVAETPAVSDIRP